MKTIKLYFLIFLVALCWLAGPLRMAAQTPVEQNGQLQVIGLKLCNRYGNPIQLRGMSTHGIQWYGWGGCLNDASLDALAYDWGADILRISLYVQEGGYESNPAGFTNQVKTLINEATERGMYALVDWHQLSPGDPNYNLSRATTFFTEIANTYKDQNNIIYDVCNEPNGVSWATIKNYADQIIPVIRNIDNDAVVLVGTHGWASMGISDGRSAQDIVNNPLSFSNIMYTFHFYANSHRDVYLNELDWASDRLPVFVTEFGTQEYTGDGPNDFTISQRYIDLLREKKISWTNWNFSDDFRSGAVWNTGTCSGGPWTTGSLKEAGLWIRDKMRNPADDFPGGGGNQAPTVTLTAPASGATYTAPATVTLQATAADADGSVASVTFYQGSTPLGTDNISPYSYTWTNVSAGSYALTAVATDNNGVSTTSSAVNVTVNGTSASNLALNKSVTVSSIEGAGLEGGKAVDGSTSTRWASVEGSDQEWISVDLGATYAIERINIVWETALGENYSLQVSGDGATWSTIKTVTGNTSLTNNHTGLSGSGRYVRVYCTLRGTEWGFSIYELEVYGSEVSPSANVALNKSATVSSIEGAGLEGDKAVDGSTSTRWASLEGSDLEWISVDLGATYAIDRIRILWETALGEDYTLQVSNDGTSWSAVKTITGNTSLTNDHTGLGTSGRYVRVYCTRRGTEWGFSIYELEVYGSATTASARGQNSFTGETMGSRGFVAYPNPVEDKITLRLSSYWLGSRMIITDDAGKKVMEETITEVEPVQDLSVLPAGVYTVEVVKDGHIIKRKIVKK